MNETIAMRPLPKRPQYGLQAWLATMGYLAQEYSPDALLTLRATAQNTQITWTAVVTWGNERHEVINMATLPVALRDLWKRVERGRKIFKTLEAATRSPLFYTDDLWIDPETDTALNGIIRLTKSAFQDWLLVIIYRPIENPDSRVQARIIGSANQIFVSGSGGSIHDACRALFNNAAPTYFAKAIRDGFSL